MLKLTKQETDKQSYHSVSRNVVRSIIKKLKESHTVQNKLGRKKEIKDFTDSGKKTSEMCPKTTELPRHE